jgi:hypothetical protein
MGWRERDWFLGGHAARLFDQTGNIGPSRQRTQRRSG